MAEFPDSIVEQAWVRSGGYCECERTTHGHTGKCHKILLKGDRGNRSDTFCWEAHSKSELHLDSLSDCEILCCKCHYATF